jgi:thioredoxin 1
MIAPIIDELASENAGSIKVGKLNTDNAQSTAMKYDVTGIPTIMLFKDGEVVERFVGVQPKSRLQEAIDSVSG